MILLIDNFDSFTYNIYQYLRKMGHEVSVFRNDELSVDDIERMNPSHIIVSPGPGSPDSAGICVDVVRHMKGKVPILGICLGHQCIGKAFGGEIVRAAKLYHGKTSEIEHDGKGVFSGVRNPFVAARYHSLVIKKATLPDELEVSAVSEDGEIMAVRHKTYSIVGLQFHPESVGSEAGYQILENFVSNNPSVSFIQPAIRKVVAGTDLGENESRMVMEEITSGSATPAQIASLLTALSIKTESVSELTGFIRVMREKVTRIPKPDGRTVVDTCGTGGDTSGTFNISTVSAFVAAGAGVTVAKHGNRCITSRCGSADVLEALGVNIHVPPDVMAKLLDRISIAFLFAPGFHQSMKHAVPVRKDIGIRTVFNILGPLANPADADCQLVGVFDASIVERVAQVLMNLGMKRAMVVHGSDGLDEITLTGKTLVAEVRNGWVRKYMLDPRELGFQYCSRDDLKGGELRTNCEIMLGILDGMEGPKRDVVILNASAAIYLAGKAESMNEAVGIARHAIDEGAARKKLEDLVTLTNS